MMTVPINRRAFVTATATMAAGVGLARLDAAAMAVAAVRGAPHAEKLGWRLGCQAYSFRQFSFYDTIEKTASLGLHYLDGSDGQRLGGETPDVKLRDVATAKGQRKFPRSPAIRREMGKRLADAGVKLVSYGMVKLPNDAGACREAFDFAKEMAIETLVAEPPADAFDVIDKLCREYQVNVAIHNHRKPSEYDSPEKVLEVCRNRSSRIGACADTGHWMRSGINPLDAIRKLEGRIITFHIKEVDGYKIDAHDVPFGTGSGDMKAWLTEIKRQKLRALFAIEYASHPEDPMPDIARCVEYFDKVAVELAASS